VTGLRSEEFSERRLEVAGWPINVVTYRVGERYYCTVDNVSPGARVARGEGASKEEAEEVALEKATRYLSQTRRVVTEEPVE